MAIKLHFYICTLAIALLTGTSAINSQILGDQAAVTLINSGIDDLYNLQFDRAEDIYDRLEQSYPGHPVNYLFRGLITYWKNYPLHSISPDRSIYEEDLRRCIQLSEQKPYSSEYEAESLLANICARGLLLLFYSDNDLIVNVIPLVTGSYKYLLRSFDFVYSYSDFYYFTGIYNYYREAYPRIHPGYRALASLFPPGDMIKGLNELKKASESSIFLKAESYIFLSWLYTSYENNYLQASKYSEILSNMYPENQYFRVLHVKNLLLIKRYDDAENILNGSYPNSRNVYCDAQLMIFKGILQEKKYKNYQTAKLMYEDGISSISPFGSYGEEFCGYAYLGLSRISEHYGDKTGKQVYRRKGNALIDYKKINFD